MCAVADLRLMIRRARDPRVNPRGWECYWYAAWAYALAIPFKGCHINPQQTLQDTEIGGKITPDFVVVRYTEEEGDQTLAIVEIKPAQDNKEATARMFEDTIRQLEDQIFARLSTVKLHTIVFGIIAVGEFWRYYKYKKLQDVAERPYSAGSSDEYVPSSDDEEVSFEEASSDEDEEFGERSRSRVFDAYVNDGSDLKNLGEEVKQYIN